MRKFLLSSTTRDLKYNKIKVYNNNNQEKNIRIEYTKLLINLRQVALQFIDDMISKEILSKSPDLISIFDYNNILYFILLKLWFLFELVEHYYLYLN